MEPDERRLRTNSSSQVESWAELFRKADEQSVPSCFGRVVERYPHRLALGSSQRTWTFAELNRTSNQVAHVIQERTDEGGGAVALLFATGTSFVVAILAVLKLGRMYVPLDRRLPVARLAYMLRDSQAGVLVTGSEDVDLAYSLAQGAVPVIDMERIEADGPDESLGLTIPCSAAGCLYYTSGSSGQPKGVVHTHRNMVFEAGTRARAVQLGIDDRVATFHFISALISMTTSLSTLLVGASLHPLEIRERSRKELVAWLEEQAITVTAARMILPQMFHSLPEEEVLPKLRVVTFGGDAFHSRYIEWARESFSPDLIRVGLACTETGAISQLLIGRDMEVPDGAMPAGYVVEGKQVLLLDEEAQECSDGEAGEIAVRSRYLSPGYWRQPELTRARFLPDPEGGDKRIYLTGDLGRWLSDACSPNASQGPHDSWGRCLVHLGRKDEQVKIRGYRVEIGEVEHALFALQVVREAVVVGRRDREGGDSTDDHGDPSEHSAGRRLVAYVVPEMPTPPTVTGLRRELERTLPDYMIPSTFVFLDALPRSKVGKVDRQALPAPGRSRPNLAAAYVAPRSPVEETLVGIWAELLELERVGVHDDFFELGGDSILVMQVLSRMREKVQVELSLQQFFKTPMIAGLARSVEEARKGARAGVGEIKPISRRPRLGDG